MHIVKISVITLVQQNKTKKKHEPMGKKLIFFFMYISIKNKFARKKSKTSIYLLTLKGTLGLTTRVKNLRGATCYALELLYANYIIYSWIDE